MLNTKTNVQKNHAQDKLRFNIRNNSTNNIINILNNNIHIYLIKEIFFLLFTTGRHESSIQRSIIDVNSCKFVACPDCIA